MGIGMVRGVSNVCTSSSEQVGQGTTGSGAGAPRCGGTDREFLARRFLLSRGVGAPRRGTLEHWGIVGRVASALAVQLMNRLGGRFGSCTDRSGVVTLLAGGVQSFGGAQPKRAGCVQLVTLC